MSDVNQQNLCDNLKNDRDPKTGAGMVWLLIFLMFGAVGHTLYSANSNSPSPSSHCVVDIISYAENGLTIAQIDLKVEPGMKYSKRLSIAEKMCSQKGDIKVSGKFNRKIQELSKKTKFETDLG